MAAWQDLFPESFLPPTSSPPPSSALSPLQNPSSSSPPPQPTKTFAQALNACDIPLSQLPVPCIKGNAVAVKIPEEEYKVGLEGCKNNLQGRLLLAKRDAPIRVNDLRVKLLKLWQPIGQWKLVPIGRGFYEFSFTSIGDLRKVLAVGSWNINPYSLRLFS